MVEQNLIINQRELRYKGIFRSSEIFRTINHALEELGYNKKEKKTEELVTETGKRTTIELRPDKVKTSYFKLYIKIRIILDNVTLISIEKAGQVITYEQGDVLIIFDSWVLTDYADRWNMKPLIYFLKALINKYIYKFPLESGFVGELVSDTATIYARLKKLLNSYKIEAGAVPSEAEVMKLNEEDIKANIAASMQSKS